jgi:hypothetical protein
VPGTSPLSTDIFIYAERRTETGWSVCGRLTADHGLVFAEPLPEGFLAPKTVYQARNYSLFAILANVRNPAHGVTPYEFIAAPRGLPANLSDVLASWVAKFGEVSDAGWLLLRELEEFPWHQRHIQKEAMVARSLAPLFAGGNGPFPLDFWPSDEPISYSAGMENGVTVRWVESYAESVGEEFLVETIGALRACGPPDDVRIIFWFD